MLFVGTSIIHHSAVGVFSLCNIWYLLIYSLQVILGHANVGITMNLYVHVTEDEKVKEVERIESALKIV